MHSWHICIRLQTRGNAGGMHTTRNITLQCCHVNFACVIYLLSAHPNWYAAYRTFACRCCSVNLCWGLSLFLSLWQALNPAILGHRSSIPTDIFFWVSCRLRFPFEQVLLCFWMQALSPAMEQWRKRISRIAASFEANKAEISTAEKQTKSAHKPLKPEVTGPGSLQEGSCCHDPQL